MPSLIQSYGNLVSLTARPSYKEMIGVLEADPELFRTTDADKIITTVEDSKYWADHNFKLDRAEVGIKADATRDKQEEKLHVSLTFSRDPYEKQKEEDTYKVLQDELKTEYGEEFEIAIVSEEILYNFILGFDGKFLDEFENSKVGVTLNPIVKLTSKETGQVYRAHAGYLYTSDIGEKKSYTRGLINNHDFLLNSMEEMMDASGKDLKREDLSFNEQRRGRDENLKQGYPARLMHPKEHNKCVPSSDGSHMLFINSEGIVGEHTVEKTE